METVDQREVIVPVGHGDDEVVEMDVHQHLFKVTFLLAGFLQPSQLLKWQWICGQQVPVTAIPTCGFLREKCHPYFAPEMG